MDLCHEGQIGVKEQQIQSRLADLAQVLLNIQKDLPISQNASIPVSKGIGMLCEGA